MTHAASPLLAHAPTGPRLLRCAARLLTFAVLLGGAATPVPAQVSEGSGPLSEITVRRVSRSVHDGATTLREGSVGPLTSPSMHSGPGRSMLSGPVSDISAGSVHTGRRPASRDDSMTEASAGAVKKDIDRPLGERISSPLHQLTPLRERLREILAARDGAQDDPAANTIGPGGNEFDLEPPADEFDQVRSPDDVEFMQPDAPGAPPPPPSEP